MKTSRKLSQDRINEIKKFKDNYDEELPPQTGEQLKKFKPLYGEEVEKDPVYMKLDSDVLQKLRSSGKGYQARINDILRREVFSEGNTTITFTKEEKQLVLSVMQAFQTFLAKADDEKSKKLLSRIIKALSA